MRRIILVITVFLFLAAGDIAVTQAMPVREAGEQMLEAVTKFLGRAAPREIGDELAKYGGETFVRVTAERITREGGKEALKRVAELTTKYGPDVLRAVDNAPPASIPVLLRALDDIPAAQLGPAITRLGAGQQGQFLATLVQRYGAGALRTEIAHPGIGVRLVQHLGDDGIRLSQRLGREEAITVARHAEDIAQLPSAQRESVLRLLYDDTKRMLEFLGRFIERNPGKALFTGATTAIILTNSERVLGGDEIIFDKDGNPQVVSKPGLLGRTVETTVETVVQTTTANILNPLLSYLLPIIAIGLSIWIAIQLLFTYRNRRRKLRNAERADLQKNGPRQTETPARRSQANRQGRISR